MIIACLLLGMEEISPPSTFCNCSVGVVYVCVCVGGGGGGREGEGKVLNLVCHVAKSVHTLHALHNVYAR